MKKLIYVLFLVSSASLAQDIYCPESVTCSAGICKLNPDNGHFLILSVTASDDNNTYYFNNAFSIDPKYPYYQDQPPQCIYYTTDKINHIYLIPNTKIIAHAPLQNSEWMLKNPINWECHKPDFSADSPQNCPFTVVEASQKK